MTSLSACAKSLATVLAFVRAGFVTQSPVKRVQQEETKKGKWKMNARAVGLNSRHNGWCVIHSCGARRRTGIEGLAVVPAPKHLAALATEPQRKLHILGLDGHAARVDCAQVGVRKQRDDVRLSRLLDRLHSRALEAQALLLLRRQLAHQALERRLLHKQLRAALELADLAQRHRAWAPAVRALHARRPSGRLWRLLALLGRGCLLGAGGLLRAGHLDMLLLEVSEACFLRTPPRDRQESEGKELIFDCSNQRASKSISQAPVVFSIAVTVHPLHHGSSGFRF